MHFESPEVSLLGSSPDSCIWAAELGLPYVFADFINPGGAALARHYRQNFCPSELLKAPRMSVAAWVICAETDAEAERLSFSFRMMMTLLFRGQSIPVPTVERAERFLAEEGLTPDQHAAQPADDYGHAGTGARSNRNCRAGLRGGGSFHRQHHARSCARGGGPMN